ncbi:MAG: argininosuccinate lyase [Rhodospirillaceae bacterium]|nr:argininosuccinate lyase [Rhodospirillaceae bacterium]
MKKSKMWGGRFTAGPADIMERINASIAFDQRLFEQDIACSKAHVKMLLDQGIISSDDGSKILNGLDQILIEIETGKLQFQLEFEDIHLNIESRLKELIGDAAGRLHTARSRNDQVATDFRLWVRDTIDQLDLQLRDLQAALIELGESHFDTLLPGLTHLQPAQPITFGHHMLAYVEMLGRDRSRLSDCRKRLNECPLGSAALAGTSFPVDRNATALLLGFDRPMPNSLDAVSARDFAAEFLSVAAITAVNLSRFAEEIVLWASPQFGFVELSDSFSTGSSIMPQKRNPDAAELARGKTGRILGSLQALLVVIKGLPLAYAKDLQEDKEPVFDAADSLTLVIAALTGMLEDMKINKEAMVAALAKGYPTATDLADWLVRELDLPFRDAHHVTGVLVRNAESKGCELAELSLSEMQKVEKRINDTVFSVLSVEASAASRTSFGGTAPQLVREALAAAKERYL